MRIPAHLPGRGRGRQRFRHRHSPRRRYGRWVAPIVGGALIWSSLAFMGYAAGWTVHKHRADARLVSGLAAQVAANGGSKCVQAPPQTGQLAGVLDVPSISLQAPVEQGTSDAVLAVAAGHAPGSVWPGGTGSSVLLAHDVSYFVHLGNLKPGDMIMYRNQCTTVRFRVTGRQIVQAGAPVYNSRTPTLILDTCWPTNALFYTTQRLLVTATAIPALRAGATGTGSIPGNQPLQAPAVDAVNYTVPAPPALVAQGLSLTQNEVPMGTMTLAGDTSPAWEESPGPLALEAAALEAYFGGIHAAGQRRTDWWSAIAPGVTMPVPLTGSRITANDASLNVSIYSIFGSAFTVTLTTVVTVSGGSAPGTYNQAVTAGVRGSVVTLQSWAMSRG